MIVAGLIVAIILWLVSLTHQWYVYAIAGILAASVAWSYISTQLRVESFAGLTPPEIKYRLAYLAGHIAHGDRLSIALIEGGIIIVFAAIAVVIADRIPFRRDDDPLSRLTIVGALLALVYLARYRCAIRRCAPTISAPTSTRSQRPAIRPPRCARWYGSPTSG